MSAAPFNGLTGLAGQAAGSTGGAGWRGLTGVSGRRVAPAVAAAEAQPHGRRAAESKEEDPIHV